MLLVDARSLLFASILFACRAPASELPENEVLRFGVGHMGGFTGFVVQADGTAEYTEAGGRNGSVKVRGRVTPDELAKLEATLRANDFCSLVSHRATGVPDEARPSTSVRLGQLDCAVQMWDGEFRDDAQAKAALAAVEGLARVVRERGDADPVEK